MGGMSGMPGPSGKTGGLAYIRMSPAGQVYFQPVTGTSGMGAM
jgi:hypothetical protein